MDCACVSQSATLEKFRKIFQDLSDKNKMVAKSGGAGHTQWGGGGVLPIMADTGRLCPKGVPFSGLRYMKGLGFHQLKYMKGYRNLPFGSVKGPKGPNR